ncbi:IS4 family transposase [Streptomyces sp. NPDC056486]|uniref:IS4 family transposase n=1 Tax=Streptomyces sp. NPDC056486 TaxID=3345835 RepID=UPI003689FBCF
MPEKSVITSTIETARGVFAPGHLGELTQVVDFALVDAVLEETGRRERRLRLLPSRVVVYFVLALALFERCSYRTVWSKLTASLTPLALVRPAVSSLTRARRRVGASPLRRLFETLAGPVARPGQDGSFYRGLRTVAIDGTLLHTPDDETLTWRYPKRAGESLEFGYPLPLLRLLVLVECGTCALIAAAFGPESTSELPYAKRLLGALDKTMLLLADAAFDGNEFLDRVHHSGAQFLVRSGARRVPTPAQHLGDGSYIARIGYGVLRILLPVRVIEATLTVTLADGTVCTKQWRLLTNLLDPERYPAAELVDLYHRRWQAETTYSSIKATMLDGRVLRSRSIDGLDQEVYALLTAHQALIRTGDDALTGRPGVPMERISFTVLLTAATDTVIAGHGIFPGPLIDLVGTIGHAALGDLLPAHRRQRAKARTRKNPTSKYGPNAGQHPQKAQNYTVHTTVTFFEHSLNSRSHNGVEHIPHDGSTEGQPLPSEAVFRLGHWPRDTYG